MLLIKIYSHIFYMHRSVGAISFKRVHRGADWKIVSVRGRGGPSEKYVRGEGGSERKMRNDSLIMREEGGSDEKI